jgi:uncharacterized membrane-anchored protein
MRQSIRRAVGCIVALHAAAWLAAPSAHAQESSSSPLDRIAWANGPVKGQLNDVAQVSAPAGCRFTDAKGAKDFMVLTENPPTGREAGVVLCKGDGGENDFWFVVFEYDASGYVKDDEKTKLNAKKILSTIQEGTEAGNGERRRRGWEEIEVTGWQAAPFYDDATHNLTWATRLRAKGGTEETVNHSVRLLGRGGVMNVDLVASKEQYAKVLDTFSELLSTYEYVPGSRYAEWRAGDKVAEYGLTALVAGGAGAAAMKLGLFGKLWKFILGIVLALKKLLIVAVAGVAAFMKKLFGKKKEDDPPGAAPEAPAPPTT